MTATRKSPRKQIVTLVRVGKQFRQNVPTLDNPDFFRVSGFAWNKPVRTDLVNVKNSKEPHDSTLPQKEGFYNLLVKEHCVSSPLRRQQTTIPPGKFSLFSKKTQNV